MYHPKYAAQLRILFDHCQDALGFMVTHGYPGYPSLGYPWLPVMGNINDTSVASKTAQWPWLEDKVLFQEGISGT